MEAADAICETAAERACLAELRALAGRDGTAMEAHCLRVFEIACELAARRALDVDREVLLCAAWLHDAGLYPGAATDASYVEDGRALAARLLGEHGWPAGRIARAGEAIERHHELRAQWGHGAEVELLRRADLVDVSGGLIGHGIERSWIRAQRERVPARGMVPEIGRLVLRAARERPRTLPAIFLRRG